MTELPAAGVRLRIAFYNLREGRPDGQVMVEVQALAEALGPDILGGCEAVGYQLPDPEGYDVVRNRSSQSRANVFAYVRKGLLQSHEWHDLTRQWERTDPGGGKHAPRSFLELRVEQVQVIVGQQPPITRYDDTIPAQQEGAHAIETWMNSPPAAGHPAIAVCDWNDVVGNGPRASEIAGKVAAHVAGDRIDKAIVRGLAVEKWWYVRKVSWQGREVTLKSDHKDAFVMDVRLAGA